MPEIRPKESKVKRIRISEKKLRLIIRCFIVDCTATQAAKLCLVNRNTANRYYSWLRDLVTGDALKERSKLQITNGIEIDESYFGPRRVREKGGRGAGRKIIVLGLLKRKGRVYCQIIPDASKAQIMPIIRATVREEYCAYDTDFVIGVFEYVIGHVRSSGFPICPGNA